MLAGLPVKLCLINSRGLPHRQCPFHRLGPSIVDHHPKQHHRRKLGILKSLILQLVEAIPWRLKHPVQIHLLFHANRLRGIRCLPCQMHQSRRKCNHQLCHMALAYRLCHQLLRQRGPHRGNNSLQLNNIRRSQTNGVLCCLLQATNLKYKMCSVLYRPPAQIQAGRLLNALQAYKALKRYRLQPVIVQVHKAHSQWRALSTVYPHQAQYTAQ